MKTEQLSNQMIKKAPTTFSNDDEDDDFGDIDENNDALKRQIQNNYQSLQPHREDGKKVGGISAVD
jgi:hypothetical protein